MDKKKAEIIIDYVVTETKPRWSDWIYESYSNLTKLLLSRGYEQGGFSAPAFFKFLKKNGIGSIKKLGSILENYKGEKGYSRIEKGSLESPFYRDLKKGLYGDVGRIFYSSVERFLNEKIGNPGGMFWMKLWQMLICSSYLKMNYNSSFKIYLKKKYCEFKNLPSISNKEFFNIPPSEWRQFLRCSPPWDELYGIGENVFDFVIGDIKEFKFADDSFKLDAANIRFFKVTGISELFDFGDKYSVVVFLKKFNLKHKYSVREINTGIYTYCSETEEGKYGFCRDIKKCEECRVNTICEKRF